MVRGAQASGFRVRSGNQRMHIDVDHRWGRRELAVNSRAWVASSRLDFARTLRAVERHSRIVIIQKDQSAVGDSGTFDMKADTAVLLGKVVLTQGQNVVRGDQLTTDLNAGLSRTETKKAGQGHVQSVFVRNSGDKSPRDAEKGHAAPDVGTATSVTVNNGWR